jgi:5-methylcytosine-specific restriction endonuclease McrA
MGRPAAAAAGRGVAVPNAPKRHRPARPIPIAADRRPPRKDRGYDETWLKVRAAKLAADPLCERCRKAGRTVAAEQVHHKDHDVANNADGNLESLCFACHQQHHAQERRKG